MYLINTLGWRWARRELSEQPQKEHVEHRIERQKWQRAKMAFEQGARGAVGDSVIRARKTRGNRGNIGIAPPPESSMLAFCPKWRLAVDVGANGGKCQRERGER